eukprot:jgi/Mesvir1/9853/Mv26035-RA.1
MREGMPRSTMLISLEKIITQKFKQIKLVLPLGSHGALTPMHDGWDNAAADAAASPAPAGSGDTSRALVVAQQPPGLNASPLASPDPKRARSADKTGGSSRPSEPRFRLQPFQVDDHDWTNMSPASDALDCIFYGDYASLYDLCLHLHATGRLLVTDGRRWHNVSMVFGSPRPVLHAACHPQLPSPAL